jgi:phosphoribosyl-AMP cyclohydrolase
MSAPDTPAARPEWLDAVRFDERGLVPAIAQDATTGRVLMLAWMNAESLERTVATGEAIYFSRSRGRLWRKGEESGHVQKVADIRLDCDGDAILLSVQQLGGIACHTGRERCFFRTLADEQWQDREPVLESPEVIYGPGRAARHRE